MTILKKDLQSLQRKIKALGRKMEKLTKDFDEGPQARVTKKATAKSVTAKPTRRSPAQKAHVKKKTAPPKATDQVLRIISRLKKGVDTATLMKKTGFDKKKITNILQRTYKQGKIKRVEKGIYVSS